MKTFPQFYCKRGLFPEKTQGHVWSFVGCISPDQGVLPIPVHESNVYVFFFKLYLHFKKNIKIIIFSIFYYFNMLI